MFYDGKLHIVFCDVGQGDGILITTPSSKQILIDAGPDQSIVDCLSKHMPFWDRTIEVALLTHPHADHFMGYYYVVDRYHIEQFATEKLMNKTDAFVGLVEKLREKKILMRYIVAGDRWRSGEVMLTVAAPTDEFITSQNPDRFITNSAESASLVMQVTYGKFAALLTGDAPLDEMREIGKVEGLDILQIPHHGSNTGVDGEVLATFSPHIAVISVGKNNYGHPTPQTLGLLKERGISVLRTDEKGTIDVMSDGLTFEVNGIQ